MHQTSSPRSVHDRPALGMCLVECTKLLLIAARIPAGGRRVAGGWMLCHCCCATHPVAGWSCRLLA